MYSVTTCQESFAKFSWNEWHIKLEIYAPLGMHVFEPHSIASDCSRTRSTYQTLHFKKEAKICRATSKDNSKRLANQVNSFYMMVALTLGNVFKFCF